MLSGALICSPPSVYASTQFPNEVCEAEIVDGVLFRSINRHGKVGKRLSDHSVARIVKARAAQAGLVSIRCLFGHRCAPVSPPPRPPPASRNAPSPKVARGTGAHR